MKIDKEGIEFIKLYEGCELNAYLCPANKWTIGVGHTGLVEGKPITKGMKISEQLADTLLSIDIQSVERTINNFVLPYCPLNQHRFNALASFIFNIGEGAFKRSTMLKFLKAKHYGLAAGQFDRWIYVNGKESNGLRKRRKAEKALFLKNDNV